MRISDWSSDVCSSDLLLAQRLGPQLSRVVGVSGGSLYGNGVFRRSVFAGAFLAVRFTGGFCARNAGTRSCCGLLKAGCTTTRESTSAPIRTLGRAGSLSHQASTSTAPLTSRRVLASRDSAFGLGAGRERVCQDGKITVVAG